MSDMIQQYHNRIISEINLNNYDSAISNCRKILRADETDWRAKFYLGYCRACKKQSTESTEDITEMNRHIDRTLKEISRISFIEQELAYREISRQLVDYATSCENELQKVYEKNNGEYAPVQLRRRAHRVYGMLLSMEKLLEDHVNATSASQILSEATNELRNSYPLLSDIDKEDSDISTTSGRDSLLPRWNSSCLLTALLFVILFLVAIYTLKSLYTYLYTHHVQQTQAMEQEVLEEEAKEEESSEEEGSPDASSGLYSPLAGGVLPVYYYEVDKSVTSGNTSYTEGSPFEQLVDECKNTNLNPTLKVFDELVKKRIFIKTCDINLGDMEDIGMEVQTSDGTKENENADFYEFSEAGSQELLKNIFKHMSKSNLFTSYSVKDIYKDVVDNMPEFTYSPEKIPCYYTFIQIRFQGMAYLWQIYTCSDDGYYISKISAEMMGIRYIKGGAAGSSLHFKKLDLQSFANQMLFMEAAEHILAGKHEIQNCIDFSKKKVSDTTHEFRTEYGDWKESVRFYESGDMGAANEEWRDNHMLKAELCIERKK